METATVNISMPQSMKSHVDTIVATEGYGNTSEFFRDLVRNYIKENDRRSLRSLIIEGLASPSSESTKEDFEQIRATVTERILAKRNREK